MTTKVVLLPLGIFQNADMHTSSAGKNEDESNISQTSFGFDISTQSVTRTEVEQAQTKHASG